VKNAFRCIIIAAVTLLSVAAYAASIPTTLSYQGTMVDKSGQSVTDTKSIVFNLYSTATEGIAFWTETQTVAITNGKFTAQLGAHVANLLDLGKFGGDTWLGLTISGEPEMTPREKMTSVPYAFNGVPRGVVTMWSGSIATIPQGWAICDGTNGTPNLKDRFIVGAGNSYAVGATGGEATHTLTLPEIPSHNHPLHDPGHTHYDRWLAGYGGSSVGYAGGDGILAGNDVNQTGLNTTGIYLDPNGGGLPHENRPPYYALAYIMKL
jgi:microcystin-dependent protein